MTENRNELWMIALVAIVGVVALLTITLPGSSQVIMVPQPSVGLPSAAPASGSANFVGQAGTSPYEQIKNCEDSQQKVMEACGFIGSAQYESMSEEYQDLAWIACYYRAADVRYNCGWD